MNHLLYNVSVILIIIGIVILTNSLSYSNKPCKCNNKKEYKTTIEKDYPSKVFDKMFDSPSVWMGYSDTDSKEFVLNSTKKDD